VRGRIKFLRISTIDRKGPKIKGALEGKKTCQGICLVIKNKQEFVHKNKAALKLKEKQEEMAKPNQERETKFKTPTKENSG
jgi:hypothetical protein